MVALPKTEDVRKAGEHAVEVLRTPLLAALGAGDLATQAVRDAVNRTRSRVNEGAGAARGAVDELPRDLASVRENVREKLDPAELRKLVDEYTEAAQKLYQKLADQGEDTLTKLRTQPQVRKALDQLEEAIATLQARVGDAAGDARELADEVLAKVTGRTRSTGEKAARTVEHQASEVAEAIEKSGDEVAKQTRRTTRRTPARTEPRTAPAARKNNANKPSSK